VWEGQKKSKMTASDVLIESLIDWRGLFPIDFVKVAEARGGTGVRIDNPKRCNGQLREPLRMDGPVVIECVVDPK